MSTDLHPTPIKVYGYGVAWIPTGHTTWTMELDEDYLTELVLEVSFSHNSWVS